MNGSITRSGPHHDTRHTWWLRGLLAALAIFCLVVPAAAQEPTTPSAPPTETPAEGTVMDEEYIETVDVRVVNVEVFVTDKKGVPILGLTADDFEVFEDGRPVQITNFYAVEDRRRIGADGEPITAAAPVPTLEAGPVPLIDNSQQLNLIVYIDNYNLRPFNRNRVFRRLRTFLRKELDKNDRVMVVSYDRSLHVRQTFTKEMTLVNAALFDMEDISAHGVHADSERTRVVRAIESAEDVGDAMIQLRPHAQSVFNDLNFTISALDDMVESLAGLSGRKAVMYVSDGLPMKAAEDLFYMVQQKFHYTPVITEMMDFNAADDFRKLGNKANANGVTFYTIDAAGLRTYSSGSVEYAEAGSEGMGSLIDSIYIQSIQEPLEYLADATGGRAILNTNDISDDLLKISADFNSYYSLGYTPAHAGDGRPSHDQGEAEGQEGASHPASRELPRQVRRRPDGRRDPRHLALRLRGQHHGCGARGRGSPAQPGRWDVPRSGQGRAAAGQAHPGTAYRALLRQGAPVLRRHRRPGRPLRSQ